ncbi:MAG: hypothetical protein HUU38_31605 [Anaerolineales bacterium]|nr:hypothetical protein [Anaerolineales bacterium]
MNLTKPESTLVSASDNKVFIATEESPHEFNSNIANAKETTTNEDTFAKNELQIQEANGTPLWAKNFRFEQNQLMIDTCFDKPDDGDWIVWEASLNLGEKVIPHAGTIPITQFETSSQKEQRCDTIYFENVDAGIDFSNAEFIIERILASPREGEECTAAYLAKYQKALEAQDIEITVACFVEELEGGGGMSGVRVASKPDSMRLEEAEAIINGVLLLDVYGLRGPWVFPLHLEK